ncbi:MAG: hypothetical protein WDM78_18790 [Puia sp.]
MAHSHYKRVPNYRDLTPQQEWELLEQGLNRVTDTCIPEEEAFRKIQKHIVELWKGAEAKGERYFPHEYMYKLLLSKVMEDGYEIDPKDSWMIAAGRKKPSHCCSWLGRFHDGKYFFFLHRKRRIKSQYHEEWY